MKTQFVKPQKEEDDSDTSTQSDSQQKYQKNSLKSNNKEISQNLFKNIEKKIINFYQNNDTGIIKISQKQIEENRQNHYRNTIKLNKIQKSAIETALWLTLLSFLGTAPGIWFFYFVLDYLSGFNSIEEIKENPLKCFLLSLVLTTIGSILVFIPVATKWDNLYKNFPELRCQQSHTHDNSGFWRRFEVKMALLNLFLAALLTGLVAYGHIYYPNLDKMYFDNPFTNGFYDFGYFLISSIIYWVWIDLWAYIAHRILHMPLFYKRVHKLHHQWKQPTAYVALALHPTEFLMLQWGCFIALYFMPMHPACILANLLYVHYYNLVDHSGVYAESWIPWMNSSLFHDDHHKFFHANYGQFLTIWDKIGGTFYQNKKTYNESTFSY